MMYVMSVTQDRLTNVTRSAIPGQGVVIRTSMGLIEMNHVPQQRDLDLVVTEGFDLMPWQRSLYFADIHESVPIVRIDRA